MKMLRTVLLVLAVVGLSAGVRAQTGTVAPSPYQVVLGTSGAPSAGALIYTYAAGTTTAATTYTDNTLAVANTNPIVANAYGQYVAFLVPGQSYKFTIKTSAGATLKTVDGIQAVPASSGNLDVLGTAGEAITAGDVVYLSDGSGARTAGTWWKADADNSYSSTTAVVGLAPAAIASAASGTIRVGGTMTGLTSLVVGTSYYVSGTAGALTASAPAGRRLMGVASTTSTLILSIQPPTDGIVAGAVMMFNLAACPAGWTEYTAARGRYLVGLVNAGTLAATVGTALTNTENRAVGEHTHVATSVVTDAGHTHTVGVSGGGNKAQTGSDFDTYASGTSGSSTTGVTVATTNANAGTVAGTNAPYLQLLVCVRQ